MEQNKVIETIGSITKMEHLRSMETDVMKNTLVLNNVTPFPGLQDKNFTDNRNLGSYFIILRYRYAPEKINRINHSLFKELELNRYPSYGEIITPDNILPCIRLKGIHTEIIDTVQNFLKNNHLQFMVYKNFNQVCRIKIFKTFKLIEISDGLYRDLSDAEKFYLQFDNTLNWKRFDYIVKKIRRNLDNKEFDAAMGVIYRFCGPQNVIRIFDRDKSLERALLLRKWFASEIKKEINIRAMP
jgi:hypothetical protein